MPHAPFRLIQNVFSDAYHAKKPQYCPVYPMTACGLGSLSLCDQAVNHI